MEKNMIYLNLLELRKRYRMTQEGTDRCFKAGGCELGKR